MWKYLKVKLEMLHQIVTCPDCGNTYRSHISLANHFANVNKKKCLLNLWCNYHKTTGNQTFSTKCRQEFDLKFKCDKGFVENTRLCYQVDTHTQKSYW